MLACSHFCSMKLSVLICPPIPQSATFSLHFFISFSLYFSLSFSSPPALSLTVFVLTFQTCSVTNAIIAAGCRHSCQYHSPLHVHFSINLSHFYLSLSLSLSCDWMEMDRVWAGEVLILFSCWLKQEQNTNVLPLQEIFVLLG